MDAQFLAGAVFAWVIAYVAIGLSFCIAYLVYRREPAHLVFGLHAQALAVYAFGFSSGYLQRSAAEARFSVILATAGAVLGSVLILHFSLIFSQSPRRMRVMRPVYAAAALVEIANACGLLFDRIVPTQPVEALSPFAPPQFRVHPNTLGFAALALSASCQIASTVLLARTALSSRRPRHSLAAFIGSTLMSATMLHDALVVIGAIHGLWTSPYGGSAFIFIMAGAFVVRSGMLSKELTEQSAELKRRSSELRQSYEELREAQRELTRKEQLAAIGELAAVIAHEIRNPLAVISNAVAALKRRDIGQDDRETLLVILKEESSRLNRLVGDLLRYARPVKPQKELLPIRELIDRTLLSIGVRDDLLTEVQEEGTVDPIWADPGLLRQVFNNLIDNAVQAMSTQSAKPQKLTIVLRAEQRDGVHGVCVDVRDSGEGMDANVRMRAMDPFFTTRPSGTGLGLAIVDRIIDVHQGEIRIQSERHSGTTVNVFLPVGGPAAPSSSALLAAPGILRER